MNGQSAGCIHGTPEKDSLARFHRIRMIALLCVAVMCVMVMGGCSSFRPGKTAQVPVKTVRTNRGVKDAANSSAGRTDAAALPTGKPMNEYQKLIVDEAGTWIGTPYRYAHAEKDSGTDCSGMVMMVYDSALQVKIPRNSARQAEACMPLAPEEVEGGDLVFFATGKDSLQVSHVGIMLPDGVSFIHASSSKGVVISSLTGSYYRQRILMYGRVPAMHALMSTSKSK